MTARIADESKLGSYVKVVVRTAGQDFKTEGYATLVVRSQKPLQGGTRLKNPTFLLNLI